MRSKVIIKLNYSTGLFVELLLTLAIALCTVFHISSGVTYCFSLTFVVFVFMVIRYISDSPIPMTLFLLVMISFFNVVLNALFTRSTTIGLDYFKKLIMFFCTMVYLYAAVEYQLDRFCKQILMVLPLVIGTLLIGSYYFFGNTALIAGSPSLGFVNPNFAGMWLLHVLFYAIYDFFTFRKLLSKIICLLLTTFCLVLLYKIYARSCFMGLAAFAAMMGIGLFKKNLKLNKYSIVFIAAAPLMIAFLYLAVERTAWFTNTFLFLVRSGKNLNTRSIIWSSALRDAGQHLLLGNYSGISNGLGMSQLHNTHIDVLCSYGIIPALLFVISLTRIMQRVNERIVDFRQYTALCGFVGVLFIGVFEAALVSGSTGLYLLSGGLLFLTNHDAPRDNQDSILQSTERYTGWRNRGAGGV